MVVFTTLILDSRGHTLGVLGSYSPKQLNQERLSSLTNILREAIRLKEQVGNKDTYTMSHSELVGWYAFAIASRLGLKKQALNMVFVAGLLHDIGKVCIPDRVLKKNGPLNQSEFDLIRKHPLYGRDILSEYEPYFRV